MVLDMIPGIITHGIIVHIIPGIVLTGIVRIIGVFTQTGIPHGIMAVGAGVHLTAGVVATTATAGAAVTTAVIMEATMAAVTMVVAGDITTTMVTDLIVTEIRTVAHRHVRGLTTQVAAHPVRVPLSHRPEEVLHYGQTPEVLH